MSAHGIVCLAVSQHGPYRRRPGRCQNWAAVSLTPLGIERGTLGATPPVTLCLTHFRAVEQGGIVWVR